MLKKGKNFKPLSGLNQLLKLQVFQFIKPPTSVILSWMEHTSHSHVSAEMRNKYFKWIDTKKMCHYLIKWTPSQESERKPDRIKCGWTGLLLRGRGRCSKPSLHAQPSSISCPQLTAQDAQLRISHPNASDISSQADCHRWSLVLSYAEVSNSKSQ